MADFFSKLITGNVPLWVQIFGFVCILASSTIYLHKDHRSMLYTKMATDTAWLLYHIFTFIATGGSLPAAAITVVAIFRSFVFINRDTKKWASGRWWLFVFMAISVATTSITWLIEGGFNPFSLLTLSGSIISIFSFYQPSARVSRMLSFVIGGFMISYYIINYIRTGGASAASILNEIINFIVTFVSVFKYDIFKKGKSE